MKKIGLVLSIFSFLFGNIIAQNCGECIVNLPTLPEDTLFLSSMPDGTVGTNYSEALNFRMPKTTTPVNAIDPGTPAGLDIEKITLISINNLPVGMTWETAETEYIPDEETDGCIQFCGTPLVSDTFEVEITIAAQISVITQTTSFKFRMVINPSTSNTAGFSLSNNISCGPTEVDIVNNIPSNGQNGISYFWDFGNGNSTINEQPNSQKYTEPGVYPINYQAVIDTVGYLLTSIEVLESGCRDLPSFPTFSTAPDMNIKVLDTNDSVLFLTPNYDNTFAPIEASTSLSLGEQTYRVEVIDDDGGLNLGDDDCGIVSFNRFTTGNLVIGDLTVRLTIVHPVDTVNALDSVVVYAIPADPEIISLTSSEVCGGQSVILETNYDERIQWFQDGILIPEATEFQLEVSEAGEYYVQYQSEVGCPASSEILTVTLLTPPATPAYVNEENVLSLFNQNNLPEDYTITWLLNGEILTGEFGTSLCIFESGNYTLSLIDETTGCSNSFTLNIPYDSSAPCLTTDILELAFAELMIFPNPFADHLTIQYPDLSEERTIRVFNGMGQMVLNQKWLPGNSQLNLVTEDWQSGIYLIEMTTATERRIEKLVRF